MRASITSAYLRVKSVYATAGAVRRTTRPEDGAFRMKAERVVQDAIPGAPEARLAALSATCDVERHRVLSDCIRSMRRPMAFCLTGLRHLPGSAILPAFAKAR